MKFWIKKIILWPKNEEFSCREILLHNNMVNIITGDSRTGKSSLIPIVDYCLCSSDCGIPVDTIRDYTAWFGVLFAIDDEELLLCRKEPAVSCASGDMYFERGQIVDLPQIAPERNAHVEDVKSELNRIFGIMDLEMIIDGRIEAYRPSFRDVAAFLYQPQNIIANPDSLFYKLDEFQHKQKLASIFPYILGAVTEKGILDEKQLQVLRQELNRKRRELTQIAEVSQRWKADIGIWLNQAAEMGLLECPDGIDKPFQDQIVMMKKVLENGNCYIKVSPDGLEKSSSKIGSLEDHEAKLSSEIATLKSSLDKINSVLYAYSEYNESIVSQKKYLSIIHWMNKRYKNDKRCRICGEKLHSASESIECLLAREEELDDQTNSDDFQLSLGSEKAIIMGRLREKTEALHATSISLRKLKESENSNRYMLSQIERFLGKMDAAYDQFVSLGKNDDLIDELNEIEAQISELAAKIDRSGREERLNLALTRISHSAQLILAGLDVEHPAWQVDLDYRNLALRVTDDRGVQRFLNQIGSASNWLSYHIALILALQCNFQIEKPIRVPSFLICDQPSQVYFPHEENGEDRDKEAVKKIFQVFNSFVSRDDYDFQIIVTEHAGENIWGSIPMKYVAAHWQENGEKLIPKEWIGLDNL